MKPSSFAKNSIIALIALVGYGTIREALPNKLLVGEKTFVEALLSREVLVKSVCYASLVLALCMTSEAIDAMRSEDTRLRMDKLDARLRTLEGR